MNNKRTFIVDTVKIGNDTYYNTYVAELDEKNEINLDTLENWKSCIDGYVLKREFVHYYAANHILMNPKLINNIEDMKTFLDGEIDEEMKKFLGKEIRPCDGEDYHLL